MFNIDYRDPRPLYEQLADKIEKFAIQGILKPDEQLPSVRQLAIQLSVNPNTVQKAYTMLDAKGVTYAVKGRGIFVSPDCTKAQENRLEDIKQNIQKLVKEAKEIGATEQDICSWLK